MMDLKAHKILITGGTGFLGSYIIRYLLQQGCTQLIATRRSTSQFNLLVGQEDQVQWVEADITDYKAMEPLIAETDIIIHAAAMVSFVDKDADALIRINAQATGQLVDLALRNGMPKFLFVSSVAALGRTDTGQLINEDTLWTDSKLNSKYAISKQWGEREVWRGHAEGLSMAIVNPSFIIGGGNWNEGPTHLYQKIDRGLSFYPTGTNGVVDVRDVATMIISMLENEIEGERLIACAKNMSHQSLFSSIAINMGKRPPHRAVTPLMGTLASYAEGIKSKITGNRPIVTRETITTANLEFKYDHTKSIRTLDFSYRDVDQTIAQICTCYQKSVGAGQSYGVLDL